MLVVGPNSTCDVCMESYMDAAGMPHVITCGHIFCRACLDGMQPQCPLCRDEFSPQDIRKLRVDSDAPSSATVGPQVDTQVQRLLDDIAKTANGAATIQEMQRVIDLCDAYHNAQSHSSPHTPLGVSYLLLSTLLEAQRKLLSQADQLSELAAARDDIRARLTLELEAAQLKYRNSEQARRNEKETAMRNEEAFRVHLDKLNALWRCKVESTKQKYHSLRKELDRLRRAYQTATHDNASSDAASDTAIPRRTITADSSSGVAEKPDKVEPPAFLLGPYPVLVFKAFVASVGCVLFLHASAVVLQWCAK